MSIRQKTLGIVGITVVVLVAVLATITYFGVTGRFARLEIQEVEAQIHRVQNELNATLANLETTAADWAPRDDTYQFVQDADPAYVKNNLVDSTFTNLRLNFMFFFNSRGELVYGRCIDLEPGLPGIGKDAVAAAVRNQSTPSLLSHAHEKSRLSGVLMIGSVPYLVCSQPIVTSNYTGPIRGTLVIGRALSGAEIQRIGRTTKADLTICSLDHACFKLPLNTVVPALRQSGGAYAAPISVHSIAGYGSLSDLGGRPVLIFEITRNRDMYQYGLTSWRHNAAAMMLFGSFFIVLLLFVLDRTILNRLKELAAKVNEAAGTVHCAPRLDTHPCDEIGQVAESINTMLDSLERYHTQQLESDRQVRGMVQESERCLQEMLDSVSCGIMVVDVETRRVLDVNAAGVALFQRSREDIIGRVCHRFVCLNEEGQCPVADLNQAMDLSQRKLLRADGTTLPILKSVVKVERDGAPCFIESFIDISDLKKAEVALRHSEERYRRFFEDDITGDCLTGVDGTIIDCNRAFARIFGYDDPEAVLGRNALTYYSRASDRTEMLARLQRERKLERIDLELVHRNGRPIYCIGNIIGHFGPDGQLREIISYLFDDTKRVQLEKDLRQAHKLEAIGTLAGGIAHDFNNILSGIMGYTEIAMNGLPAASPSVEILRKVLGATCRARELVHQILTFSRQGESDPRPLSLAPIIKEALKLMRASLPATIDIRQQLQKDCTVVADPVQIHQVVMNLCTNAGYAMRKEGGTLTVSMEEEVLNETVTDRYPNMAPGVFVRIGILDTGEGIPPEVLDRIFDPFFTTKGKTEGTGLGLSVVHGIVSKLGGAITATSDEGSRFDIYLPSAGQMAEPTPEKTDALPLGNEAIVLVDDEAAQVEVGTGMLSSLGYRVTGFTDSLKALEYITANTDKVQLVITDMTMPQLTGASLAVKLLANAPRLPIILCTGYSESINPEKALALGIRGYVHKPVLLTDLARKIREILDGRCKS
jgi:two-component system, cell cycle sensor histidine kinase and response regulator CckA